jgi:hypothetical protein
LDPCRIIAQKCGRQIAIDKAPRGRAQPEIVHKDSQGFAAAQESESQFQCAKIFRTIYQDDITRPTSRQATPTKRISNGRPAQLFARLRRASIASFALGEESHPPPIKSARPA